MARLVKRLGKGYWEVEVNGKIVKRKLMRTVRRDAAIVRWVNVGGRKVIVEVDKRFVR